MINREEFEKLPEIREIMNSHVIYFMNHSGFYEAAEFKDFEYEQYVNGAWYVFQEMHKKVADGEEKPKDKESVMNKAVDMARDYGTAFIQLKINTANEIEYKNIGYGNVILRKTED